MPFVWMALADLGFFPTLSLSAVKNNKKKNVQKVVYVNTFYYIFVVHIRHVW